MFERIFECTRKGRTAAFHPAMNIQVVAPIRYGLENLYCLPSKQSRFCHYFHFFSFSVRDLCKVSTLDFSISSPNVYTRLRVCSTESN